MLGSIGRTTLYRWIKEIKGFPQPIKLGPRVTVFRVDELILFREAQAAKSLRQNYPVTNNSSGGR